MREADETLARLAGRVIDAPGLADRSRESTPDGRPLLRRRRGLPAEVRDWLETNLVGEFAALRGRGGPGDEGAVEERRAWEKRSATAGWTCVGWPKEWGGRGLELSQQVIFHEEYARARRPGPARPHRRDPARPDADRLRHRRAEAPLPAADRRAARSSGARATRSPTPAPTSPTCRRRARARRRRVGASTGRRSGPRSRTMVGLVLRALPHRPRTRRSTTASRTCSCRCGSRASRSARSCR